MDFDKKKDATLKNMIENDHSKKGCIDEDIRGLIDSINSKNDYYTTSSCSGRITMMEHHGPKNKNSWLLSKHSPVTKEEFDDALLRKSNGEVWFRQESPILHLCARDVKAGKIFLEISQRAGFKYVYFLSVEPRVMLEVQGSEKMETIIFKDKILVDDDYAKVLISEANTKLLVAKEKLKRLHEFVSEFAT